MISHVYCLCFSIVIACWLYPFVVNMTGRASSYSRLNCRPPSQVVEVLCCLDDILLAWDASRGELNNLLGVLCYVFSLRTFE
jgi:hypothetical protein